MSIDIVIVGGVPQWKPSIPIYFVQRGLRLKLSREFFDPDKFMEFMESTRRWGRSQAR